MIFKKTISGVFLLVIMAAPVFFFAVRKPQAGTGPNPDSGAAASGAAQVRTPGEGPVSVKVAVARRGELVIRLRSPGEAMTTRMIVMKAGLAGVLKELKVNEGLHVKAGDLLARLDDERPRLALERQEASRLRLLSEMLLERRFGRFADRPGGESVEKSAKATADFAAAEAGFRQGTISRSEFEKASQDYERTLIESGMMKDEVMAASNGLTQAEIDVKTAELDLAQTVIRAPFAGIITDIKVSPGEPLEIGRDLFTLVSLSEIKVIARVLESEVGKIRAGREVALRFSACPDKVFAGVIEAVSPVVNPGDRTCAVHVVVENPREEIKPGMHAEVEIAAEVHADRLLVPQDAVLVRGGRQLVFVVEDGLAKWRYVEVGLESQGWAEVLDGVNDGDQVIIDGHLTLAHDARVSVVR